MPDLISIFLYKMEINEIAIMLINGAEIIILSSADSGYKSTGMEYSQDVW